ncbi:MAG: (d)CMP kinase [Flavobacteriaceae bacterium]|nr:(d)CMP kinase [Flavobacteriaceae bacterium]
MLPNVIAIDGHSSTGKSSLAKRVAKTLGYVHIDTGAMYRAISLFAIENNLITVNELNQQKLISSLSGIDLDFEINELSGLNEIYLNGRNVEKEIRSMEVSGWVSQIAKIEEVRAFLVNLQRRMAGKKGIVMDGRDIGTVVFPDAPVKIFLTANAATRANRRYQEIIAKGMETSYEEVLSNIIERDFIDSNRSVSPLRKADDAIEVNNDAMDREQTYERVMQIINEKLSNR